MSYFQDIQEKIAKLLLNKALIPEREVVASNLKNAKSVGIIYLADSEEATELVRRYVKFLKEYKIKVKSLGYYHQKELPLDVNAKLEFDFITKKDLNLRLEPVSIIAKNFIEEDLDILIDTSVNDHVVMQYIVHHSKSKFKVGAARLSYQQLFDLTIVLKQEEGVRQLMKNIDRYLHVINN